VRTYRDLALGFGVAAMAFIWSVGAIVIVEWFGRRIM